MLELLPKKKIKDSVFVNLFQDKKYLLQLYQALHPEDPNIHEDEFKNITIDTVLVNTIYNDLGFLVKDKLVILVESQSTWSENILIRILFYVSQTYRKYLNEKESNLYGSKPVYLPEPELYMIYTGKKKNVPDQLTLSTSFFGGKEVDIEVHLKVLSHENKENIIGQYIIFCKVFDEQRKIYGNTSEAIQKAIQICKDQNILKEFLESRESEVESMMLNVWDQEKALEFYIKDSNKKVQEETEKKMREENRNEVQKAREETEKKMRKENQNEVQKVRKETEKKVREETEKKMREESQNEVRRVHQELLQRCQLLLQIGKITLQDITLFYPQLTSEEIDSLKPFEK